MVDGSSRSHPGNTGASKQNPRGADALQALLWGVVFPGPGMKKGAALPDQGCAGLLLGSALAAPPGTSHSFDDTAAVLFLWRFLLLGPRCWCRLLLLPPDDGGGEEGGRMFLKEKISTLSLNSKLRYTFLLASRHSSYSWSSWLSNPLLYRKGIVYFTPQINLTAREGVS